MCFGNTKNTIFFKDVNVVRCIELKVGDRTENRFRATKSVSRDWNPPPDSFLWLKEIGCMIVNLRVFGEKQQWHCWDGNFCFQLTKQKINLPLKSRPRKEFGFGLDLQGETGGGWADRAVLAFAYRCFLKQPFGWAFVEFNLHPIVSSRFFPLSWETEEGKRKKTTVAWCWGQSWLGFMKFDIVSLAT